MWPIFVYSFLKLIEQFYIEDAKRFMARYRAKFETEHPDEVRQLAALALPEHLTTSDIAKTFLGDRYRLTFSEPAYFQLIKFMEDKNKEGGSVLLTLIHAHMKLFAVERASVLTKNLLNMLKQSREDGSFPAEDEGIPGHNPGSANTETGPGQGVLTRLKLGPLPLEPELLDDVLAELKELDEKEPPTNGKNTLVEEYQQMIKCEETDEAPSRDDLPLPPSMERDVLLEVHRTKENRDRYRLGTLPDGGTNASTCMFTFHNAYDL